MERMNREAPLPPEMQGEWKGMWDPGVTLVVDGGLVRCFGQVMEYDFKLVGQEDGAIIVSLGVDDLEGEDEFARANVTDLVITPEGEFHAYNVKFSEQFTRGTFQSS
ncbi:hypothetical protein PGB28_09170 [Primorskyibacter aestuariivivens]|uniref:hypothetical protein n=1 Tax=Primorskyibacter aestuariivivens TaxID=1888912 RepID=UPI002300143F|nr:hypothetical protein [Primorskyibacter aestuariivivens]MDA7428628.1 hypothetical protein [Primorskyibacter aestuariivivens]